MSRFCRPCCPPDSAGTLTPCLCDQSWPSGTCQRLSDCSVHHVIIPLQMHCLLYVQAAVVLPGEMLRALHAAGSRPRLHHGPSPGSRRSVCASAITKTTEMWMQGSRKVRCAHCSTIKWRSQPSSRSILQALEDAGSTLLQG